MTAKASLFLSGIGSDICSPFFDSNGKLHIILQNSGEIASIDGSTGQVKVVHSTGGQPSGAVHDPNTGTFYIADFAHAAVLAVQLGSRAQEALVTIYEDRPLKGPNSIVSCNGSIYFTDSGPFGETGLHSATGSLFSIGSSPSGQILRPISLNNLASPQGVALSPDGKFMFV